jgi:hypothetical protein
MSSINADNGVISGITGVRTTADNTGNLALQANGVTLLTVNTANVVAVASGGISIAGANSGAITIAAPAVAGTNTLTLPANTGTVALTSQLPVAGPTFSAYQSVAQTLSSGVSTKIQFQTKEWDTNNNFDSTTNYRFTPTVAGYYQVNAGLQAGASATIIQCFVYKNGSLYKAGYTGNNASTSQVTISALVYCNGSTDYIEIYGYFTAGQITYAYAPSTYFQGFLARTA